MHAVHSPRNPFQLLSQLGFLLHPSTVTASVKASKIYNRRTYDPSHRWAETSEFYWLSDWRWLSGVRGRERQRPKSRVKTLNRKEKELTHTWSPAPCWHNSRCEARCSKDHGRPGRLWKIQQEKGNFFLTTAWFGSLRLCWFNDWNVLLLRLIH